MLASFLIVETNSVDNHPGKSPRFSQMLSALLMTLLVLPVSAAVNVDRAELSGGNLRVEGDNATSNSTVSVQSDTSSASGNVDDKGQFRIEASGFSSINCTVSVVDNTTPVQVNLTGCTPTNEEPPPPPPPPPNQAPTANAGPDRVIPDVDGDGFEVVTFDGTGSFDPDGSIASYFWNIQSTGDTQLGTEAIFSVIQPVGTFVVELQVLDDAGASSVDSVIITIGDAPTPLPQGPFAVLVSEQAEGSFDSPLMGASVASAGDVNGDGFADVIVGALGYDAPAGLFDEGAAFVFLGGPDGIIGNSPFTAHASIIGTDAGAEFGTSVDGAGDVNGDGYDDIIVGAPLASPSELSVSGAAYVFLGGPTGITASTPADADFVIESKQIEGHMGRGVAGAGDINNDGFDDIIVSAGLYGKPFDPPIPNQGSGRIGASFVFLGSGTGIIGTDPASAHAQILPWLIGTGNQTFSGPGSAVDSAGDINADGFGDLVVGSSGYNNNIDWPGVGTPDPFAEGAAFIFLGGPSGLANPSLPDAIIEGNQLESAMGGAVAGAGDINNDSFDDVLIGAPFYPTSDPLLLAQEGAVFVFHGGPSGITATGAEHADAAFFGTELAEWLGRSVAGAGDINADGFADILVGARTFVGAIPEDGVFNGSRRLSGEGIAYLFLGDGGPSGVQGATLADAALNFTSGQEAGSAGLAVDTAGDVNLDGRADLAIGVPGWTGTQSREGAAFIQLSGGPIEPPPPPPPPPNQPPVANAGTDQQISDIDNDGSELVSYDGSASFDPDGTIVSWNWRVLPTGNQLNNAQSFTVRQSNGTYTVELTVTDDQGATATDIVIVSIDAVTPPPPPANEPPIAVAGADQSVTDTDNDGLGSVLLNGTGSTDPDGSIVSYEWSEGGSVIGTSSSQGAAFSVGIHTVTLTVTDDAGATATDTLQVIVEAGTPAPDPGPVNVSLSVSGPASVGRGDVARFDATIVNISSQAISNVSASISISPNRRLKNLSPGGTVNVGSIAAGASVTLSWSGSADKSGSATATVNINADGTTKSAAHSFNVVR